MAEDQWLTIYELASELQIPVKSLRAWRLRGTGPTAVKIGRHVRYRRADVDAWIGRLQAEQAA
jgi:excisionase family DNA binding protein